MEMLEVGQNQLRICPNRINLQEIMEDEDEDRISALPDCLLVEILSRLPSTNEAFRRGTLSKRWEHLWTMVPTLIFNDYSENPLWPDIIDKTLTQCRQLTLSRFEVETSYDIQNESQINNWIRYVVTRNVEEFSLRLNVNSDYEFPLHQFFFINSCFTDLTLEGCALNPTGAIIWENLRSLILFDVKLDEDLIENILSDSQQLETLGLDGAKGFNFPSNMEFSYAYLKHVEEADWSDSSDSIVFRDSDSVESKY